MCFGINSKTIKCRDISLNFDGNGTAYTDIECSKFYICLIALDTTEWIIPIPFKHQSFSTYIIKAVNMIDMSTKKSFTTSAKIFYGSI